MAILQLLAARGTPVIYYGDELGMPQSSVAASAIVDPLARIVPFGASLLGRDGERTPMQWSDEAMAGFTGAERSWLPVDQSFHRINVASQSESLIFVACLGFIGFHVAHFLNTTSQGGRGPR